MTRRSTRTITVLSPLSLTTTPCRIRFGIALFFPSRRLARALGDDRLDAREVAAHLAHPGRVVELAARPLEAEVEPLLAQPLDLALELVIGLGAYVSRLHGSASLAQPGD